MENLPADVQRRLALELEPYSLISLCSSSKSFYKDICDNDSFWRLKIQKDFAPVFEDFQSKNYTFVNPKKTYIRIFTKLSQLIEKNVEHYQDAKIVYKIISDSFFELYKTYKGYDIKRHFSHVIDPKIDQSVTNIISHYAKKYNFKINPEILSDLRKILETVIIESPIYKHL